MPIGIVNHESNCTNFSLNNISNLCVFENLSCRRKISIEKHERLKPIVFNTFDEAWKEGKAGKLFAILSLRKNLSKILERRLDSVTEIEVDEDLYLAYAYQDMSNLHLSQIAFKALYESLEDSFDGFSTKECHYPAKFSKLTPINFEEPIFGVKDATFKEDIFAAYLFG